MSQCPQKHWEWGLAQVSTLPLLPLPLSSCPVPGVLSSRQNRQKSLPRQADAPEACVSTKTRFSRVTVIRTSVRLRFLFSHIEDWRQAALVSGLRHQAHSSHELWHGPKWLLGLQPS